jgi:hypothetical protein
VRIPGGASLELDALDQKLNDTLPGRVVRKDLVEQMKTAHTYLRTNASRLGSPESAFSLGRARQTTGSTSLGFAR